MRTATAPALAFIAFSPCGRRWRQPDEGSSTASRRRSATLSPTHHPPFGHLLPQGEKATEPHRRRLSGQAALVFIAFSPCGRRWRQPDEGSSTAARRRSAALSPTPHPPFGHLLPQGEKATEPHRRRLSGQSALEFIAFSPCGRRWRQPDEGSSTASRRRLATLSPTPHPPFGHLLPQGEKATEPHRRRLSGQVAERSSRHPAASPPPSPSRGEGKQRFTSSPWLAAGHPRPSPLEGEGALRSRAGEGTISNSPSGAR